VPARILREVGVDLGREVAALAHQPRSLDVKASPLRGHAEYARAQGPALGVEPEGSFHRLDAVGQRQEIEDVAPREDQHQLFLGVVA